MAFSVESRVPFLTTRFAELVLSLPAGYLIADDGTRKAVLRDAMRGIVPDQILDRRDKIGFRTPERALLAGADSWTARVLASEVANQLPFVDLVTVRGATARAAEGGQSSVPLWRVLNLIRWADLFDVQFA
jgi:asparagine synthase (glutamine-hydrolysing)